VIEFLKSFGGSMKFLAGLLLFGLISTQVLAADDAAVPDDHAGAVQRKKPTGDGIRRAKAPKDEYMSLTGKLVFDEKDYLFLETASGKRYLLSSGNNKKMESELLSAADAKGHAELGGVVERGSSKMTVKEIESKGQSFDGYIVAVKKGEGLRKLSGAVDNLKGGATVIRVSNGKWLVVRTDLSEKGLKSALNDAAIGNSIDYIEKNSKSESK
jgi:hypothetical protein